VAVVISVVAAFFYIRVIVLMFFADPMPGGPQVVRPGWQTQAAVGLGVVATVAFGVFPGPLLDLAQQAGEMLR
jgi:NADH-quinone oxidoreductase subunit N